MTIEDFVNKDTLTLKENDIINIENRVNGKGSYIYGVMNKHGYSYNYGTLALEIVEGSSYLD